MQRGDGRKRERGATLVETIVALGLSVAVLTSAAMVLARVQAQSTAGVPDLERTWEAGSVLAEIESSIEDASAKVAYFDYGLTTKPFRPFDTSTATQTGGSTQGPPAGYTLMKVSDPSTWPQGFSPSDPQSWKKVTWWSGMVKTDASTYYWTSTAQGTAPPASSTPPADYCLVKASDSSTWPPGFNPADSTTWSKVAWWSGAKMSDKSTWYWNCHAPTGGSPTTPGTIDAETDLRAIVSFGDGVRLGSSTTILGPVTATPASSPIVANQAGDAVTLLRTDPQFVPLRLGSPFVTTTGVIQLVARDRRERDQIEALAANDVVLVTGRAANNAIVTAVATLRAAPHLVAVASPTTSDGAVIFSYYEASTTGATETSRWGLRNAAAAAAGATIETDAAVCVLDRTGGVVTFATARDAATGAGAERLTLWRIVGDPAAPGRSEPLMRAAGALAATVESDAAGPGGEGDGPGERVRALRVAVPMRASEDASAGVRPLEAHVEFGNGAEMRRTETMAWDGLVTASGSGSSGQ